MYNQFISLLITHTQLDSGIHLLNVEWNAISINWFPLRMAPELVLFRNHCLGSTDAQRWFHPTEESACLGSLPIFQHQGGAEMYTYPYKIIEGTITCTWYSNSNNFLILLSCIHVHSTALFSFLFSVYFTYIFFFTFFADCFSASFFSHFFCLACSSRIWDGPHPHIYQTKLSP